MKIENKISDIVSSSLMKSLVPGIGLSTVIFLLLVFAFQQSSQAWFARGYMGLKALGGASILLGLLVSFIFITWKRFILFPRSVTFRNESIELKYILGTGKEYSKDEIIGVGRDSNTGRIMNLTFETRNGDEFTVMVSIYQSKEIYAYVSKLGLTIF